MEPLDYESPRPKQKRDLFWLAFFIGYFPGLFVLFALDDILQRLRGSHSDGGVTILSVLLSPVIAFITGIIKNVWKRYNTLSDAVAFAIIIPVFLYLGLICVWATAR
jgi:hypothetical protein